MAFDLTCLKAFLTTPSLFFLLLNVGAMMWLYWDSADENETFVPYWSLCGSALARYIEGARRSGNPRDGSDCDQYGSLAFATIDTHYPETGQYVWYLILMHWLFLAKLAFLGKHKLTTSYWSNIENCISSFAVNSLQTHHHTICRELFNMMFEINLCV